ncbi:MAG: hypothetical protein ABIO80_05665 [Sphingomicrobium sp.]
MPAGAIALLALLAQSAVAAAPAPPATAGYGPDAPKVADKPPAVAAAGVATKDGCTNQRARNDREIVVCAARPQGYRLNPDVLEAKREMRSGGGPRPPESYKYNACSVVGPMGCMGQGMAGINLVGAALVLGQMAARVAQGKEIGSMFVTDPHPTEYQLYQAAKKRREAREAQAVAEAIKAKAQAALAAKTAAASAAVVGDPPAGH